MEPSPQQAAFIEAMSETSDNLMLDSRAGTGKTTTGVMGADASPREWNVLACCFNKAIQVALSERMPENVVCKTYHALGYAAWREACGKRKDPDSRKTWKCAKAVGVEFGTFPDLARLISLAKNVGIKLGEPVDGLAPDTREAWEDLIEDFALDVGDTEDPVAVARDVLGLSVKQAYSGDIDFDDMIYMPVVYGGPLHPAGLVIVDEVQDTNAVQTAMLMKLSRGGRLIGMGDPFQAIYAFRGAGIGAMDAVASAFDCKLMPLTVSYRCPRAVVAEAQTIVPDFESHPSAPEGNVEWLSTWSPSIFTPRDVILCRNNRPLIELAFNLLSRGIGCCVKGREIGQGLIALIDRMKAKDFDQLESKLEDFLIAEKNKLQAKGKDAQADNLEDRVASVLCLMARMETRTVAALKGFIETLFDERRGLVTLSTVHKAKGLEWSNVYLLDPGLIPSKYARTQGAIQQEYNLMYVAITRAQENLRYINTRDMK